MKQDDIQVKDYLFVEYVQKESEFVHNHYN